jgi:hypothetical protein
MYHKHKKTERKKEIGGETRIYFKRKRRGTGGLK